MLFENESAFNLINKCSWLSFHGIFNRMELFGDKNGVTSLNRTRNCSFNVVKFSLVLLKICSSFPHKQKQRNSNRCKTSQDGQNLTAVEHKILFHAQFATNEAQEKSNSVGKMYMRRKTDEPITVNKRTLTPRTAKLSDYFSTNKTKIKI